MGMYLGVTRLTAAHAQTLLDDHASAGSLLGGELAKFSLEKSWAGLDYLLVKTVGDAGDFLLAGGERIGEIEDYDFGPPRLFPPQDVVGMASLLEDVSIESLRAAYDPKDMDAQRVYPSVWERDGEEGLQWLLSYFAGLKNFVRETAKADDALLFELG